MLSWKKKPVVSVIISFGFSFLLVIVMESVLI